MSVLAKVYDYKSDSVTKEQIMSITIAHLGPVGTYSEQAAIAYANWFFRETGQKAALCPYLGIGQALRAVASSQAEIAVVPVENSVEGSVAVTLDTVWQLDSLQIHLAYVLPIAHALLSCASNLESINTVYSHPQALAQCQGWLAQFLPNVQLISTNSTTEPLKQLNLDLNAAAISSVRASQLYNLPILASGINDYPDNCTRFWVVSQNQSPTVGSHTSVAFSLRANLPGVLVKALQIFAQRDINLSRIESRPTKRSLGEYLFFIDLEGDINSAAVKSAIAELTPYTEVLKIFGSYNIIGIRD